MPIVLGDTTITGLGVGGLPNGTINADDLASGAVTKAKIGYAGAILQVVQADYTTASTYNTGTYVASGLSASITPLATSNKVLVFVKLDVGHSNGGGSEGSYFRLYRNGSDISEARGVNSSNRNGSFMASAAFSGDDNGYFSIFGEYLDSPSSTSAVTYAVYIRGYDASGTYPVYLNRASSDSNNTFTSRGVSRIILMEVSA